MRKAFGDRLLRRRAADVEEVGRLRAVELDDVHRRHRQAGAVDHAADLAVELDVVEVELRGLDLERVLLVEVAHLDDVLVAEEGVVVEVHLGVERQTSPLPVIISGLISASEQSVSRIGLDQARRRACAALAATSPLRPSAQATLARLERLQPEARVEARSRMDRLRRLGGDLLDLHAAGRRGDEHRLRPTARSRVIAT